MEKAQRKDPARLVAIVLRDVLQADRYETVADLVDALKFRLAQLRIAWTPDALTAALGWVEAADRRAR